MSDNKQAASAAKTGAPCKAGKALNIAIAVSAVITVAGIALWMVQLSGGMIQTGMRDLDSWGLYIMSFMFFVGLSAGGLIISSMPKAFGIKGFGGISKVAVWTSICCTVCAIGLVVVDLGQPIRLWELLVYSNLTSPLMWDVLVIGTYLVLSLFYLWAQIRFEQGKMRAVALRVISVVALVVAVLVHSVTAWILGLNISHEFWHTALLAPWFVSSALVCGTALVLAVVIALRAAGYFDVADDNLVKMAKLLGAFVCVDLYFFGCDLLTTGYPLSEGGVGIVEMLTSGVLAPFFWVEVIGCIACAVVCFTPKLRSNALLIVASVLAIVGIFCKRVQLIVGGFQVPNLDMPTVLTDHAALGGYDAYGSFASLYANSVYAPAPIEFGVVAGVFALGVLMLLLGVKHLPLKSAE